MPKPSDARRKGGGAKKKGDPLDFSTSLEAVYADADKIKDGVALTISDRSQFWFVLPDGLLPNNPEADVTVPYLRFTVEGRRANMLTRMVFMRDNGVLADQASGKKLVLEFQPCVLLSRSREGHSMVQQIDEPSGAAASAGSPPPPPKPAEPEGIRIPDIGQLLAGLQETRQSLDTIDVLLAAPDALLSQDENERHALQETIASSKDRALIGLGELGDVLSRGAEQPLEEWRREVSKALAATIEAMVAFDDLADHVRDGKRRELEALRHSIESYFATIDPTVDFEACRKFSTGVNKLILEERQETLEVKKTKLEKHVERSYDHIISALQQALTKGSTLPLIPHPAAEPAPGFEAKIVLNMIHIVMAVRFGGLSITLDTERHPRLYNELRGWDASNAPRLHIVDRRRYAAVKAGGGRKGLLPAFE